MRRAGFAAMSLLSILVASYAIGMYGFGPGPAHLPPEFRDGFRSRPLATPAHIFCSAAALLLGPLQFSAAVRSRWPALHRGVGRIYLGAAVPIGGLAGLFMSFFAYGGIAAKAGFGCLAVAWLSTAVQSYVAVRAADFPGHRCWAIRNYALTCAAITLRLYMPLAFILGVPFETAYPVVAWLCWAPNLAAAEYLVRARRTRGSAPGGAVRYLP